MWVIWMPMIVAIPVMGIALWGWWHNRQVDKYNEWLKQQEGSAQQ